MRGVGRWLADWVSRRRIVGLRLFIWLLRLSEDKSIAVLPFRNLSSDPANSFFAEGVQDDILSRLVKIRDLKVISRLGASSYPADVPRDLRAIGRTLGVRHLLEGSLRRSGNRVLLHVALIDSRDGHEVWSEGYDRELADAINLQGELASDIADALDATLSPQERRDVRSQSTHNSDAYVLFLQGRKLENSPTFQISDYEAAKALYSSSRGLDPGFALAHARLASTLGLLYRFRAPSEELKSERKLRRAKHCGYRPSLGKRHLARPSMTIELSATSIVPCLSWKLRVVFSLTIPRRKHMAYIYRRQGRWREARAGLEQALFPAIRSTANMWRNCTLQLACFVTGLPRPNMPIAPWLSRQKWIR